MKKKIISLLLAVATLLSTTTFVIAEPTKEKVNAWGNASDWALSELLNAQEKLLIPDILYGDDFTQKATREEFAEISVKVYEAMSQKTAEIPDANPFVDTENPEILKAFNLGITNGVTATNFDPDTYLTREQAAAMFSRAYMKAFDLEKLPEIENVTAFADDADISDWAKESVYYMAANKIINGVSEDKFAPIYKTPEELAEGYGCATREQALLIAVRMVDTFKKETKPTTPDVEIIPVEPDPIVSTKGENDYVIAFIGGSLTDNNGTWVPQVIDFYKKKMPDKNIVKVDAGIGGTGSSYGAMRFVKNVLSYEPDMVFIEFPVNDTGMTDHTVDGTYGMESMIRQCLEAENVPNVVIMFTPFPVEKGSDQHAKWLQTVESHQKIADNYQIPTINIYDYMYEDFEAGSNKSFTEYLASYYKESGDGYDVHGGYLKYAEAILKALNEDFDKYNVKPQEAEKITTVEDTNYRYKWVSALDKSITYDELVWKKYKSLQGNLPENHLFKDNTFSEKIFKAGVAQTTFKDASFTFETEAGIDAFCLSYIASKSGATASVTIDGNPVETVLKTQSQYGAMNYNTAWVSLPYDGNSHTVKITVDGIDEVEQTVFRFGAIVKRYKTK